MKRTIYSALSLLLMICIIFGGTASADNEQNNNNAREKLEEKAILKNIMLNEKVKKNKEYDDTYAGVYIDDEGALNVNLVEDIDHLNKATQIKDLIGNDGVKYHQVKHSYKKLEKNMVDIRDKMIALDIAQVDLDEEKDKLIVHVRNLSDDKVNNINKYLDPEIVEYQDATLHVQVTADIVNGSQLVVGSGGFTVGVGVVHNSTGKQGFVTAGHGQFANGTTGSVGGNTVGTQQATQYSGSVDAAFFERKVGWYWWETDYYPTKKFTNGDTYNYAATDTTNLVQGKTLYAYGSVSGKQTGKILAVNTQYSDPNIGTTIYNVVKADYKAIHGDSGAGVAYFRYVGSATSDYAVMGIQSASALDANGNWVTGSYSLFTRIDNIFSALNVSSL